MKRPRQMGTPVSAACFASPSHRGTSEMWRPAYWRKGSLVSSSESHRHCSWFLGGSMPGYVEGLVPWCVRMTGDQAPSDVQRKKVSLLVTSFVADWYPPMSWPYVETP